MKFTLNITSDREEETIIYAQKKSQLVSDIEELISNDTIDIIGYNETSKMKLNPSQIYAITVEDNKIFAHLDKEKLQIKKRLYELEEILGDRFVKINQSCIVNISKIERFDASFAGAMMIKLKNGYKDYVSRRQLRIVKERIGF